MGAPITWSEIGNEQTHHHFLCIGLMSQRHAADVEMKLDRNIISLLDRVILSVEFIGTKGDAIEFPLSMKFNTKGKAPKRAS